MSAEHKPGRFCACSCGRSIEHMAAHAKYHRACSDEQTYKRKFARQRELREKIKNGEPLPVKGDKKCETADCSEVLVGRVTGARFCRYCIVVRRGRLRAGQSMADYRKAITPRGHKVQSFGNGGMGVDSRKPELKCRVCAGMPWAITLDREQDPVSGPQTQPESVGIMVNGRVVCRGCKKEGGGDAPLPEPGSYVRSSMGMAADKAILFGYQPPTNAKGSKWAENLGNRYGRNRDKGEK